MMFVHDINPDIITIGPLSIRFYGIVYALGFLLVTHLLVKKAKEKKIRNLNQDKAIDLVTYSMISGLVGARLMHIISQYNYYSKNLFDILKIWEGGLAFQGGLVGGLLFIYWYTKKHRINFLQILDSVALPLPLVVGFGRIANFVNGELIGKASDLPWCVVFSRVDDICRHPSQLYQSLSHFILFGILLFLSRTKITKKNGIIALSFVTGYGLFRFITDFFRSDYFLFLFGLSHTQILNIIMFFTGTFLIFKISRKVKP